MKHGGDLISYRDFYKGNLIDFSSNINPLGPPEGLGEILENSFEKLKAYPDIKYRNLKRSVANYLNCEDKNVVVGNGAVEIIDNFIQLFDRVLVFIPSFSEYELRSKVHKKEVLKLKYTDDFKVDLQSLKDNIKRGDLLILGNPNNPTGMRIEEDVLLSIYKIIREKDGFLLLDEAFFEFCPEDYDSIEIFKKYNFKNVGIIRAATKFFALPGIRLGYGCTSLDIVERYRNIELPWSVNALADCAGGYIFQCKDYIEKSKAYIHEERKYLLSELFNLEGIAPYSTQSNYILIKLLKWNEEYVFNYFLKRGIVIRKCSSFEGLDGEYIRVAIKDREKNMKLIKSFKELGEY
ncbi:pyridoxal phosphate-dependent aminotransferase [Anaerosalibacter sp. Marseille-P3206]|uniref:pyridoxal phosphate-dependent aminotransferase n=1 Tax=Anaerosalibacter sp. Marseille-P3206 TaxID=1871005 RepID=UPI000985D29E|nr:aminotransferase class I/II-fold pyridoxal phosphate-dependent enzyme [Anaerosalibacter sp. Marseille-P3206]